MIRRSRALTTGALRRVDLGLVLVLLLGVLAILGLLDAIGAGAAETTTPTVPSEITAGVRSAWSYESSSTTAPDLGVHVHARPDHPVIAALRYSTGRPSYAAVGVQLRNKAGALQPGSAVMVFEKSGRSWEQISDAQTAFANACTSATPAGLRQLLCPSPWTVLGLSAPRLPSASADTIRVAASNLRKVEWARVALPSVCGVPGPVRLRRGAAIGQSDLTPWWAVVQVTTGTVTYGDLTGAGADSAAVVPVICTNGGGTADSELAFDDVVFTARGGTAQAVGVITPQQPYTASEHVPLLARARITHDAVTVQEDWYGPTDPTCCPSTQATTTWTDSSGNLRVGRTIVTHR